MDFLPHRNIQPEKLDAAPEAEAQDNLADLRRINRWLGGHAVLRSRLRAWYKPTDAFRMLDIGAASGDMGNVVRAAFPKAMVFSLDHQIRNLHHAAHPKLAADAFSLPLAAASFDVVACSLFLHHFTDAEVVRLLQEMRRVSRAHLLAIDLQRNIVARNFLPATRWLFGWHDITLHDGPVSVEAAFHRSELQQLAETAGLPGIEVRPHYPWFRLSLTASW